MTVWILLQSPGIIMGVYATEHKASVAKFNHVKEAKEEGRPYHFYLTEEEVEGIKSAVSIT